MFPGLNDSDIDGMCSYYNGWGSIDLCVELTNCCTVYGFKYFTHGWFTQSSTVVLSRGLNSCQLCTVGQYMVDSLCKYFLGLC